MKKSALTVLAAFAAAAVCAAPGELVPNGSFEEGTAVALPTWARTGYTLLASAGTESWTGAGYITVDGGAGHHFLTQPVPNGIYALALTKEEVAQTEVTIPASGQYVVSWYAVAAWTNFDFKVAGHVVGAYLDDSATPILSSTQDTPDEWRKYSAVVSLQAGTYTLKLKGSDTTQKASASIIDCVSILPYAAPSGGSTRTIGGTEYVYLLEDYNIAAYTSGDCWSDGAAPSAEKAYLVADGLSLGTEYHSRTFPGGSLRVGAEGSEGHLVFSDRNTANANATATMGDVTLAAGSIDTFSAVHTYSRNLALAGTYTVTATRAAPFRIRGKNNHPGVTCRFGISGAVAGGDDACLVIEGLYGESADGYGFQYNGANGKYTAAEQPLRDYTGRIIVDGTNTTYYVYWHSGMPNGGGVYWFGAPPAAYMADAFTLRNGAKLSFEDTYWVNVLETPNRGMTVENGGAIHFKTGNGAIVFGIDVAGTGTLTLANTVTGSGSILFNSTLATDVVDFSSGKIFLGQDFALGAGTTIHIASNATLVVSANGLAPSNAVIEAGATLIAGVGNGAEFVAGQQQRIDGSKKTYARPRTHGYGCLTLSESSSLSLPVTLALESLITLGDADRFPVLKVPSSVAVVTSADFTVASGEIQVETAPDGLQTVYLTRTSASTVAYVVPEGTPGVDPTPPYDSWATAATNIQDAVDASSANGIVKILAGRYPLASQVSVPVALRIASCAAMDDETPDREGTVIDAHGLGRCFYCTAENIAFVGLTFANGAVDPSAVKGGGVYFDKGFCALYDCIVTNCSAQGGGGVNLAANNSRLFLEGTRFVDCSAAQDGGGVRWWANIGWNGSDFPAARYSQTTILDCEFIRCTASGGYQGGGVSAYMNGDFWAERCLFQDCQVLANNGSGGAFYANNWTTLIDCVVDGCATKNKSVIYGRATRFRMDGCVVRGSRAGSAVIDGQAGQLFTRCAFTNNNVALLSGAVADTFRNCLFAGNALPVNVYNSTCENCTFAGNPAGGLYIDNASRRPVFVNCVSAANGNDANISFASGVDPSGIVLTNCCIQGATAEVLARDPTGASFSPRTPRFIDAAGGNYRLAANSPLREAALPLSWMVPGSTDLDGNPRLVSLRGKPFVPDALPDIGCYECQTRKALGTTLILQ